MKSGRGVSPLRGFQMTHSYALDTRVLPLLLASPFWGVVGVIGGVAFSARSTCFHSTIKRPAHIMARR